MNCKKCLNTVIKEDKIICSECKTVGHYYCFSLNKNYVAKMPKTTKNKWTCNDCKIKLNKKNNQQVSIEKSNIESLAESVQCIYNNLDEFSIKSGRILNEMKLLKEQNTLLIKNNEKLITEVQFINSKIDRINQKSLDEAIKVKGIPLTYNEDCKSLINELSNKLNVTCNIENAYRKKSQEKTGGKIIAWLSDKTEKKNLISAIKRDKTTAKQLRVEWPSNKIYINEHLTIFKSVLLNKTKTIAKAMGFEFIWTDNADILIRKNKHTKIYRIRNEMDLKNLIEIPENL
ncbi:Zinc finger, FYVE/PHD-type,Zinc finger, RING/FYVE/PHD-type [Cinara cedri]|uniref:Zinc finger, FYVE/PHD-type,Zinc finger, RING/FYVE/PHD-type n=1 Tax=Cinara cedri TaxID=506608 RepID=A0A5E4NTM6_9HEMI|nr:Zinc finger, FYVE/PHD-type,Zinc finger, RING/FYVE/PHD-type [Cinara cedri]